MSSSGGGTSGPKAKCARFLEPSSVSMTSDRSMMDPPTFSSGGEEPSSVSMKSDLSIMDPPTFSSGGEEPSSVSMTSDRSMMDPPTFSSGGEEPSSVSMKSDWSIMDPPTFSSGGEEPSSVSMKSDWSMMDPPTFSSGGVEPSIVSMKIDRSMMDPPKFSSGAAPSDQELTSTRAAPRTYALVGRNEPLQQDSHPTVDDVLQRVIKRHKINMKKKYESLFEGIRTEENKTLLNRIYTQLYIIQGHREGVNNEHEVLQMEKTLKSHEQDALINCSDIFKPLQDHKDPKYKERKEDKEPKVPDLRSVLTKGIAGIGKTVSVQKFILDWAEGKANQDIDFIFMLPFRELNLIKDHQYSLLKLLCDFHPELKNLEPKIYDELKTVFIFDGLDESRIPLNFAVCGKVSEIVRTSSVDVLMTNLIKGELLPSALIWITCRPAAAIQIPSKYISRVTEIQGFSDPQKEEYFRKRISDQDQAHKIISHITKARSLHIMCHIPIFCWISATVLQRIIQQHHKEIPKTLTEMYSHFLITQANMKNEKYEKKDESKTKKLLESNRTELLKLAKLAFKQLMKGNVMFYEDDLKESGIDITEASVYSGVFTEIFREECVLYQRKVYCFVHLSFQEFLAAVYVFHCYESKNLEELQFFKPGHRTNVLLDNLLLTAVDQALESKNGHLDLFLRFLLGISLESNQTLLQGLLTLKHTHSNKTTVHIKNLLKREYFFPSVERSINLCLCLSEMKDQSLSREIQEYLKSEKHSVQKLTPGQCSALACMLLATEEVLEELDMNKYSRSEEGFKRLIPAVTVCRRAVLTNCVLTKDLCVDFCSVLQSVNSSLKELDLSKNDLQDSRVKLLSAGLTSSNCQLETLSLAMCKLGQNSCESLGSALQSVNSSLKELDLSYNDLQDSGVGLLSARLKGSHCTLEALRLAVCNLGKMSGGNLGSALQSVSSSLKDLDLSNNDLQDSGVELLSAGLKNSHCKLEILRLAVCNLGEKSGGNLGSVLQSVNSSLKELDLSKNDLQDSGVRLLSDGLKSSHCKLMTLRLSGCMVSEEGCSSLASALNSNPSHLKELDLTYNHPGGSGLELLAALQEDEQCKLETLLMEHGGKNRIKPGLRKYACKITMDPNTAHTRLSLSEGNRKVECVGQNQPYPDHPDRFKWWEQVLSVESLTGRYYWEVERRGDRADIAVSYRGIRRKEDGEDGQFGYNKQSWSLEYHYNSYSVYHNNHRICQLHHSDQLNRVGVYLDWPAGTLSFYSVPPDTHTLTHIHTFYTTFTEPLYAGFGVYFGSSVCVCESQDLD